ncbi:MULTISPECIES: YbaB/EbfC family nucleoid-associated protein [Actinoplanes]|uniref:YbaB/EbfC family nucleoid-associated protein n=1 Tax=Actinoplanes TaxID=1865 RepID=UPI0006979261|nr:MULTISPECIES: YbaB/EbfC family nucleoid-associated protein [Actinoplanes]GLY02417.1 hypothetical protein Acsp01_27960 [Actinoplanes sp. NBRC 101535]
MAIRRIRSTEQVEQLLLHSPDIELQMSQDCADLEIETVSAQSTDGTVTVTVGGMGKIHAVRVDPAALETGDQAALESAVAEALSAAAGLASDLASSRIGPTRVALH